ncbi:hypothetical protein KIN20_002844 [Parelaphostrongylus tenuis]|uniref:Uncharacterized protein n=1 Tax=Parelaphostrongylus tenuis TaxID=148309 RepID=A0AAD5QDT1_PARTN|nr:hypothetical protein KIN20_002844 [Parelaphostrongylus tenuis]
MDYSVWSTSKETSLIYLLHHRRRAQNGFDTLTEGNYDGNMTSASNFTLQAHPDSLAGN